MRAFVSFGRAATAQKRGGSFPKFVGFMTCGPAMALLRRATVSFSMSF
jgi:hypothetical protein